MKVMELEGVYLIYLDFCMYGTEWRKPTKLLTNVPELRALSRRCRGTASCYSRTGRAHRSLRGGVPKGIAEYADKVGWRWTAVASPYPEELCEEYARLVAPRAPLMAKPGAVLRAERPLRLGPRGLALAEDVPDSVAHVERWHLVVSGTWDREEHQNVLECRTVVMVLRRLARCRRIWNQKVVVVTDSLVTMGCLNKGRSSSWPLLKQARASGIIQLVLGIRPRFRWVSSERNAADGPSRGAAVGPDLDTLKKGKAQARGLPRVVKARLQGLPGHRRRGSRIGWSRS